ncbi:mbl domain containing protein [Cryptosporidium ryanae]|uniref:mbl domain containing protein n=1 Tax=Cryptosporidium ryanae TaxID=515981 RepID=UPI00351A9B67|nr:mbl domain containing protein [Cryptosporidium ryanae]
MFSEIHFRQTGSGHFLSPRSLVLSCDGNRCLVNVGENTQRYCFEHKVKLSRLKVIMLTEVSVETVGGLPGLLLTLSGIGVQRLRIIGPEPVIDYLLALGYRVGGASISEENGIRVKECVLSVNSRDFLDSQEAGSSSSAAKFELEIQVMEVSLRRGGGEDEHVTTCHESHMFRLELGDGVFLESYFVGCFELNEESPCINKRRRTSVNCSSSPPSSSTKRSPLGDRCSILYLFEFPAKKGRFDVSKARSFGIPPGPLYSKLKDGESVTLDSGRVVLSEEVCSPPIKLPWVMVSSFCGIRECRCVQERIQEIIASKGFKFVVCDESTKGEPEQGLELDSTFYVFDFSSQSPRRNGSLVEELCTVSSSCIANKDSSIGGQLRLVGLNSPVSSISIGEMNPFITSHFLQEFLSDVAPSVFPHKRFDVDPRCWSKTFAVSRNSRARFDESLVDKDKDCRLSASILKKMSKFSLKSASADATSDRVRQIKELFAEIPSVRDEYPKLCVLGTGSAIPSPYRNVSGNLLRINSSTSMFLDCGEGSLFQLFVLLGCDRDAFFDAVSTVKFVFISHPHEDHFLGLFGLIRAKYFSGTTCCRSGLETDDCSEPRFERNPENGVMELSRAELERISMNDQIVVIGPRKIEKILELHINKIIRPKRVRSESGFDLKSKVIFVPTPIGNSKAQNSVPLVNNGDAEIVFESFPVKHIKGSFGIKVSLRRDDSHGRRDPKDKYFTIVFSGDTMPCPSLELASKNCNVLIHEATFEDSLGEEAKRKNHSTVSEAVEVAVRGKTKGVLQQKHSVSHGSNGYTLKQHSRVG